ncbi:14645_t:CDS:2, partial [Acaulospora colombiana]
TFPMDGQNDSVLNWDINKVHSWLSSLGFPQYELQIKEQSISGPILVHLDHSALKELGVHSVGHRVTILKAVYLLKIQHNVPIELEDYVPPSAEFESAIALNGIPDLRRFESAIQERDALISQLSKEVQRLSSDLAKLREELVPIWKMFRENKPLPEPDRNDNLSVQVPTINVRPPYTSEYSSAPPSPRSPRDVNHRHNRHEVDSKQSFHQPLNSDHSGTFRIANREAEYKSFRVALEDPCYKVLPAALKKYKITDDWRKYALFICYGGPDHPTERCLSYDEKPLLLFQKLKEANQNPVFTLKNIKDIKSPVSTAEEIINSLRLNRRTTQFLNKDLPPAPNEYSRLPQQTAVYDPQYSDDMLAENNGTAVAIYPYVPELEDELNVTVGDVFKIKRRSGGWCFVEKDEQVGWVPANFLLETNINGSDIMDNDNPYVGRGTALIDYERNTDEELSMKKDDALRIYKKQDYWLYCEINNERGWVPSWYVRVDKDVKEVMDDDESEWTAFSLHHSKSDGNVKRSRLSDGLPFWR